MLPKKIQLNNLIRKYIIDMRTGAKEDNPLLRADYISEQIGRSKSWLSQVENGRLKTVKKEDLINVFCFMFNESPLQAEASLEYEIMRITAILKHNFMDDNGNILNFSGLSHFDENRGHLRYAIECLDDQVDNLLRLSYDEIKMNLDTLIKTVFEDIVFWINRAFSDVNQLFTDDNSMVNLYMTIKTCYQILCDHYEYYALNPPTVTKNDINELQKKLNDTHIYDTHKKAINEYSISNIKDVIKNFSPEEYMMWENKHVYLGDDQLPMLVNYKSMDKLQKNDFRYYKDVATQYGLNESDYLYIIKQLYSQFEIIYQKCQEALLDLDDLKEDYNILLEKYENMDKS